MRKARSGLSYGPCADPFIACRLAGDRRVRVCAARRPPTRTRRAASALIANRNLDVLFMVDNSSSMRLSQTNLTDELPDVHGRAEGRCRAACPTSTSRSISSDMGAGDGTIAGCDRRRATTGSSSPRRAGPARRRPCSPGATFISNVGGAANYTAADISTVFSCIAALGETGCGFEHQFASVLRALGADGKPPPRREPGLPAPRRAAGDRHGHQRGRLLGAARRRRSTTSTSNINARVAARAAGELPLQRVRPPLQRRAAAAQAPNGDMHGDRSRCRTARRPSATASLTPVAEFVARIKALKAAPASEILVAAIAGPATPYRCTGSRPSIADTSCGPASLPVAADRALVHGDRRQLRRPGASASRSGSTAFGANGFAVVDLRRRTSGPRCSRSRRGSARCWRRAAARAARPVRFPAARSRASVATPVRAAAAAGGGATARRRRRSGGSDAAAGTGMSSGERLRLSDGRRGRRASRASAPRARSSRGWRRGAGADVALRGTPSRG